MFRIFTLIALILALVTIGWNSYLNQIDIGLINASDYPSWYARVNRELSHGLVIALLILSPLTFRETRNRNPIQFWLFMALTIIAIKLLVSGWTAPARLLAVKATALTVMDYAQPALLTLILSLTDHGQSPISRVKGMLGLNRWLLPLTFVQVFLGAWLAAHHLSLSCDEFPACLINWWQAANFGTAYQNWTEWDISTGTWVNSQGLIAIKLAHLLFGLVVTILSVILAIAVISSPAVPWLRRWGILLGGLMLFQIGQGAALIWSSWPASANIGHALSAALLVVVLARLQHGLSQPARFKFREYPSPIDFDHRREDLLPEIPSAIIEPKLPPGEPVKVEIQPEQPTQDRLFNRLRGQLGKTRGGFKGFLSTLALGRKNIDRDLLDDLETQLLTADIGVTATREIIDHLTDSLERHQLSDVDALTEKMRSYLYDILEPVNQPLIIPKSDKPFVILVVGINGVGKTTTIGKLAKRLQTQGHSVMLAAGDTFRAAAVEQLQTWGERNDVTVIAQHSGADSASVIFDGVQAATARGIDVLIADTAGRLHTKSNLMDELTKVKRIMGRLDPDAPHEVLLVLDAGTGQNAINQACQFNEAVGLTGIALTKLDGTAKGGVIFALAKQFGIPIRYIGIGEGIDDLQDLSLIHI